jgi:hypothetical protein
MIVQQAHAPGVVFGSWRALFGIGQVFIGQRFEADEHPGATGQGHLANQRWIISDINGEGGAPDFFQRAKGSAKRS